MVYTKFLNYKYVFDIIKQDQTCKIWAGTKEDWNFTSGTLYENHRFHRGCFTYSKWDIPQIKVKLSNGKQFTLYEYTEEQIYPMDVYSGSSISELTHDLKLFQNEGTLINIQ